MNRCAFCPSTASLTGEHIWSDWLNQFLPSKKRFSIKNDKRETIHEWTDSKLDWKIKVVCEKCNSTWMSEIEDRHAKPAMLDLILDKSGTRINESRARSIAIFAFKTTVVLDHIRAGHNRFFDQWERYEFRRSLTIPRNVSMWLMRYGPSGRGEVNTAYHDGPLGPKRRFHLYVCTYSVQSLTLQVVAYKGEGCWKFKPERQFFALPFWPALAAKWVWPPPISLNSVSEFNALADRWQTGTATY